jgi:O-succinylbenzoate synthase
MSLGGARRSPVRQLHRVKNQAPVRLAKISMREILLPLVEPFVTANGVVDNRRIVLLELVDADGAMAWSECVAEATPSYSPETIDGAWLALSEWMIPTALGQTFSHPRDAHMRLANWVRGNNMARAAAEMGLWGLAAEKHGCSLASLLADASRSEDAPRKSVETGIALGMQSSPEALLERVALSLSQGYRRIKLKVSPDTDVRDLQAVSDLAANRAALSVDANCTFSLDDPRHVAALEQLDSLHLAMIEQPLGCDDLVRHAELQRTIATPLCLDESIATDSDAESMIALNSARIVNLKPGRVGGFTESIAIHDRCASVGIPVWCGGMLESGIGRAYNVALASLPNFTLPGDLSPSSRYWTRDVVTSPWVMSSHGEVEVPLGQKGIGVEADTAYIDELTVREKTFSAR